MQQRTVAHVPVPQHLEMTVEVVLAPTERVQQRTAILDVMRLVPQERVQQRIDEQIVGIFVPPTTEEIVAGRISHLMNTSKNDSRFRVWISSKNNRGVQE